MEFYTALAKWSGGKVSYFRAFWTWADQIGVAIENILRCAEGMRIPAPRVAELDPFEFEDLPNTAFSDDGVTYVSDTSHSFPTELSFELPSGVVFSSIEGPHDVGEIDVGYSVDEPDEGLTTLRAVVDEESLVGTYLHLVEALPDIQVFWIKLHADWEDDKEEMYTTEALNEVQKIERFLSETSADTVLNGHVTITTYSKTGATNLNIDDHKMIVVLSYDSVQIDSLGLALESRGVFKREQLIGVDQEFHHWHYRPSRSRTRKELITALEEKGFVKREPEEKA